MYGIGSGNDTIDSYTGTDNNVFDTVEFILWLSAYSFSVTGQDLIVTTNLTDEKLNFKGWFSGKDYQVDRLWFTNNTDFDTDDTYLTQTDIEKKLTNTVVTARNNFVLGTNMETLVFKGTGNFIGTGNSLDNCLNGGGGNDVLGDRSGNDILNGVAGNDKLDGGAGADSIYGGAGNDRLYYDTLDAVIDGGLGFDLLDASKLAGGKSIAMDSFISIEGIIAGAGNDTLAGDSAANRLEGGSGNDILIGDAGEDTLLGGLGTDTIIGGQGNDILDGGAGNDYYVWNVGWGNDVIAVGKTAKEDFISLTDFTLSSVSVSVGLFGVGSSSVKDIKITSSSEEYLIIADAGAGITYQPSFLFADGTLHWNGTKWN